MATAPSKRAARRTPQQQLNHKADQGNTNRGTSGTNQANAKVHGNRGAQRNPNRHSG